MILFRKAEAERPKPAQDLTDLRASIHKAHLPPHVAAVVKRELERLDKTDPAVAEYSIGLNYLDYLIALPWQLMTEDNLDLNRTERVLDRSITACNRSRNGSWNIWPSAPCAASKPRISWSSTMKNRPDQSGIYLAGGKIPGTAQIPARGRRGAQSGGGHDRTGLDGIRG